jgi:hypothetical protein
MDQCLVGLREKLLAGMNDAPFDATTNMVGIIGAENNVPPFGTFFASW